MFAAIAAFFLIGTFGFWLALILLGIVIFWNIEAVKSIWVVSSK